MSFFEHYFNSSFPLPKQGKKTFTGKLMLNNICMTTYWIPYIYTSLVCKIISLIILTLTTVFLAFLITCRLESGDTENIAHVMRSSNDEKSKSKVQATRKIFAL